LELVPDPDDGRYAGVGIGLQADFWAGYGTCGGFGDCGGSEPADGLEVNVSSAAARLISVDVARSRFTLEGVASGTAEVNITTAQAGGEFQLAVRPVSYSYLWPIPTSGYPAIDARSLAAAQSSSGDHYRVLADSRFTVAQAHFTQPFTSPEPPPDSRLIGTAPPLLDPGRTGATQVDGRVDVGSALGLASLTTPIGGRADFQIVDETAVHELQLFEYGTTRVGATLEIRYGGTTLHLRPIASDGRLIVSGANAVPEVTAADPSLVDITIRADDLVPQITLAQLSAGTTTLSIAWLGHDETLQVSFAQ
jgi:hypothetical protein